MMKKKIFSLALAICMVICLVPFTANAMQLFVDISIAGKPVITIEVESGDSIENIKEKIEEKTGIEQDRQILTFGGKTLQNGRTIADYNIQKETMLVLAFADISGTGTQSDPYRIYTADGLMQFGNIVNGLNGATKNASANVKLMNDIVFNDGTFDENGNYTKGASGSDAQKWTPLGKDASMYTNATFDGNGHTIEGLYVVSPNSYAGLLGSAINVTVKDLTVTGYIEGQHCAGIAAVAYNCNVSGCTNKAIIHSVCNHSFTDIGGIVGNTVGTVITKCKNFGTIISTGYGFFVSMGGIAGSVDTTQFGVRDCYNIGNLKCDGTNPDNGDIDIGGVVGANYYDSGICNSYNIGTISAVNVKNITAGGVAGFTNNENIENCCFLDSVATNLTGNKANDLFAKSGAKTKAEFANNDVKNLLINGRSDSPWSSENKYIALSGMTLPVFDNQDGDAHTHNYVQKQNSSEKWLECECGVIKDRVSLPSSSGSGGTTTTEPTKTEEPTKPNTDSKKPNIDSTSSGNVKSDNNKKADTEQTDKDTKQTKSPLTGALPSAASAAMILIGAAMLLTKRRKE